MTKKDIKKKILKLRKENLKIIFTNGCFDILHIGHVKYLKKAKELGDVLIVGINSDSSVKKIKGKNRPYINEKERAEIISSLKWVDYVIIFEEDNPINLIAEIKPDIHVKGGDYRLETIPETRIVEKNGGIVKIIPRIKKKSTTNIITKILKTYEHEK